MINERFEHDKLLFVSRCRQAPHVNTEPREEREKKGKKKREKKKKKKKKKKTERERRGEGEREWRKDEKRGGGSVKP